MIRLIDANALRAEYQAILDRGDMFCEYDIVGMVDNAPTVKLDESIIQSVLNKRCMTVVTNELLRSLYDKRPHGKWIDIDSFVSKARCSKCKKIMLTEPYGKTDFCPNCGADMRGGRK